MAAPRNLPPRAQAVYGDLNGEYQRMMLQEISNREKSTGVGYILWFLLGWHYAYVGRWGVQILYWLSFGGLLVWMLADLFRMPSIIRRRNNEIALEIATSYASFRSESSD